jgi:hypothetical protein
MSPSFCHASGMSIIMTCGRSRPLRTSSSSEESKAPESEEEAGMMGVS